LGIVRHFIDSHGLSLYDETSHKGLVRHLVIRSSFSTGKMMVCLVINGKTLPEAKKFIAACTSHEDVSSVYLCHNREPGDVVMRGTLTHLTGAPALYETLGDLRFRISPFSFFQVNPVQTVKLYDYVLESCHLTGYEVVMDLYCGTGSIALYLARHAKKVIGIESVKEAIEDARENASLNGISNVEFRCQDVLVYVHGEKQPEKPDVVILDPPRKGCECGVLESVGDLAPQRLVYISCNPATFARDAAILVSLGYTLESVKPFDLFAQTMHVESVGIFIHQSN
jgi:23S rRNA (uracil1939-C5)-methyltransferase